MVGTNNLYRRYKREEFRRHYYDLLMSTVNFFKSFSPVTVVFCCQILPRLDSSSNFLRSFISSSIDDVLKDRG